MGGGSQPGPDISGGKSKPIDPGTHPRTTMPSESTIGLHAKPKVSGKSSKAAAAPHLGIAVHPASKLNAKAWWDLITTSDDVPAYFQKQIRYEREFVFVTNPKRFTYPDNVIPKDWLNDWLSAFTVSEWEMTTGGLEISVQGNAKTRKFNGELKPDLSGGELVDSYTTWAGLTVNASDIEKFGVEFGDTISYGLTLNSGRTKLIVIADRISLILGNQPSKPFQVTNNELVNTWFHEIACHAGRISEGVPSGHAKDRISAVDSCAQDIDEMIPTQTNRKDKFGSTTTKIFEAIEAFLKTQK
jgi:hypothetical protein